MLRVGMWSLFSFVFVAYAFGPQYLDARGPVADDNQYECLPGEPTDPRNFKYPSQAPAVKIIEFTDRGELTDRCQWTDVLYEIKKVNQPKIVVLYVHGWKHNADSNDSDRMAFTQLIASMTESEQKSTELRHIVGIYVGWNASLGWGKFENLTFWDRKRAADRISQSEILTKLIGAIDSVRQQADNPRDRVILIGHSFGGRILYSATAQLLVFNAQRSHPGRINGTYSIVQAPADSIILLNPALEASAFTALNSIRRYQERFSPNQEPILVSISTNNDWATKYAFPIGQWLGFDRERSEMTTLGNFAEYQTHKLRLANQNIGESVLEDGHVWYDNFCTDKICLQRIGQRQPSNPFLIANTTSEILDGHNGIWDPAFVDWLIQYHLQLEN